MKKLARFIFNLTRGIYTILATYLLAFILPFALAGFAFHLGFEFLANLLEFETIDGLWASAESWLPIPTVWARIALFLPLHVATWWVMRKPVRAVWPYVERGFDKLITAWNWVTRRSPAIEIAGELLFTLVVTALLIPFVIQPTLVPTLTKVDGWVERTANLLDGTATAEIADSVVGLYRKLYTDPVVTEGLDAREQEVFEEAEEGVASGPITAPKPNGEQPLMDRWDPYIAEVADGDPAKFAFIKAFMWVESNGRQYAVSPTGCAGLMQFCVGTATSPPFKKIFGTGTVYRCDCADGCEIPRDVQRDLESGDRDAFKRHKSAFPCEMTDARFNPDKIIAAGGVYVDKLRAMFGDNMYLMYIGYNSGPGVAQKIWVKTGRNPDVTLEEIDQHLAEALPERLRKRARFLVRTHLPKLENAYQKYYPSEGLDAIPSKPTRPNTPKAPASPKPKPKPKKPAKPAEKAPKPSSPEPDPPQIDKPAPESDETPDEENPDAGASDSPEPDPPQIDPDD